MRQVIILAGGKGTRLAERLNGLPKPLIDICGLPLLERQILLCKRYGFTDVLVLVNHAAQSIIDFCADRGNWDLHLSCVDDGEPRGTAGATLAVLDQLADEFLVMYGDTMLDVDLNRFLQAHISQPHVAATLFLHPNDHPSDSDLVEINDNGEVVAFHPYPHNPACYYPNLVNAALYWVRKSALLPFRGRTEQMDFVKHLFPELLAAGQKLMGYNSSEYIKDCGTPTRLDKVCGDFLSGRIVRANLNQPQVAVFLDRDGTINREIGHLASADALELLPGVPQALRKLNRSDYRSIVVTNQPVLARGDCSMAELRRIHARMETLLGSEGAYLDRIYFCPHHPDTGFSGEVAALKVACNCRKPKPGLVEAACLEFNIETAGSWFVGDTLVDMATAHASGLRAVLVETGYAGMDYRESAWPDYTLPDLPSAVDFILDGYPRLFEFAAEQTAHVGVGDLVFVGGLSRSGKSNFASAVVESLHSRGLAALRLPLDGWLVNAIARQSGVLGRYDLSGVIRLLQARVDGEQRFELGVYHKLQRRLHGGVPTILRPEDVVVIDGTVALELARSFTASHRFFIEIDESERRRRVLKEYQLRGYDEAEAQSIYNARQQDEAPYLLASASNAQRLHLQQVLSREARS
ncbi:MAG: HAD-IIIA family hydrolase [Candidatus Nanopelagicaceae bacterium]|nr:HAD-IIIA family hydrolase [Candidatus Nanopelagicaceae bacterium]